jgi:signal transduction histidine kinase
MGPHRYLALAAGAVVLSWVSIAVLVYSSAGQLREQRTLHDELTQQLLSLEQMRAAIMGIAAGEDEFMMLGTINRVERSMSSEQLEGGRDQQLKAGKAAFATAFARTSQLLSAKSRAQALSGAETRTVAPPFIEKIRTKYASYLVAAERLQELAGSQVYLSFVMKVLGEAKSLQISLDNDLQDRIDLVNSELRNHNPRFDATIKEARDTLLGLILVSLIPALLTGYPAMRGIVRLFGEISAQREDITRTNQSLQNALSELRRVQTAMVQHERLSTLGKLTATVSHELRNPMAAIRNSLFLIREFAGNREKIASNVERAERSIARCDNIIGDLLEYTRHQNLSPQLLCLQTLVRDTLAEQKLPPEIKVKNDLRGSEAKAMIDPDRFQRVVINLVQNAAEAIATSKRFGEIRVQTGVIGNDVFLEVADNGPGITPDILEKIWEPLFTTKNFGAGLGLPTAKRLVEQHAGKMTVTSRPGAGASFLVTLPRAKAQGEEAA